MIYVDSSSLLKILWNEPESPAVVQAFGRESSIIVSVLTELETLVQLKAGFLGGDYSRAHWRGLETRFAAIRQQPPYEFRPLAGAVFQSALRQHRNSGQAHCRSVDRLHLAAMEELQITRLMTHDLRQAKAAIAAGFEVIQPGRE